MIESSARIVDRGYQHYRGARLGLAHAVRVMVWAAMRRAMGIRRDMRAKILPWLLLIGSFAPVVGVVAFQVITHATLPVTALLSYPQVFSNIVLIYILFAGLVAPDLLCADRRERVLSLYFSAPIGRLHYVGAQVGALALLLLVMTLGPAVLLYAASAVLSPSVTTYVGDHLGDLWHIVLASGLLALYYSAVATAVAAFTDRRAYASGAFFGLMLVSTSAASILWRGMRFPDHERYALLDLAADPLQAVRWLFGSALTPPLDGWVYLGVSVGIIVVSLGLLVWRYLGLRD
jgi:hypothetical protein